MWLVGGAPAPTDGSTIEACPGVWKGPGTRVRQVAEGTAAVAVAGECRVSREELRGALAAVRAGKWAELTRWPGSYWVIGCHGRQTFVAGDLAGVRGLFYASSRGGTVWASRAQLLADLVHASVDLGLLTAHIVAGEEQWPERSLFDQVHTVPGGYGLLLDDGGRQELVDVRGLGAERTIGEAAESVGQARTEAIDGYAAGDTRVSADLSGGLDSSTVVLTAAGRRPLRAVTYGGPLSDQEDLDYARRLADAAGVEHLISAGGPHTWHFAAPPPAVTYGPVLSSATAGLDADYLAPVAGYASVHLTGHGGDVVLESSTAAFTALLQRGERRRAKAMVTDWARSHNVAPGGWWRAAKDAARPNGRRLALDQAADLVRSGRSASAPHGWSWCRLGPAVDWLTPRGRRVVAELLAASAAAHPDVDAGAWEDWAALRFNGRTARDELPLYQALAVRPVHPFLDSTVVRACLAVPAHERRRTGAYKPLLSAARPDLPAWLLGRRSKGSFTPLLLAGLRANRSTLAESALDSPLTVSGLVDPGPVTAALNAAAGGDARAPLAALDGFFAATRWLTDTDRETGRVRC